MIQVDLSFFQKETWNSIERIRGVFPLFTPLEPNPDEMPIEWQEFISMRNSVLSNSSQNRQSALRFFIDYFLRNFPCKIEDISRGEFISRFRAAIRGLREEMNNKTLCFLPAKIRDYYGSEGMVSLIEDPLKLLEISSSQPKNDKERIRRIRSRFDLLLALMTMQSTLYTEHFVFESVAYYLENNFFQEQKHFQRQIVVFPKTGKIGENITQFKIFTMPGDSFQLKNLNYQEIADEFSVSIDQLAYTVMFLRTYSDGSVYVSWDQKNPFSGTLKQILKCQKNEQGFLDPRLISDWFRVRFVLEDYNKQDKFLSSLLNVCPDLEITRRVNQFSDRNWRTTKLLGTINGVYTEVQVCTVFDYLQAQYSQTAQNYQQYKARQFAILFGLLYPPEEYLDIREILAQ